MYRKKQERNTHDSCWLHKFHRLPVASTVHSLGLGLDLGNSLDRRRESTRALIHESQSLKKKATAHTVVRGDFDQRGDFDLYQKTTSNCKIRGRHKITSYLELYVVAWSCD